MYFIVCVYSILIIYLYEHSSNNWNKSAFLNKIA